MSGTLAGGWPIKQRRHLEPSSRRDPALQTRDLALKPSGAISCSVTLGTFSSSMCGTVGGGAAPCTWKGKEELTGAAAYGSAWLWLTAQSSPRVDWAALGRGKHHVGSE